MNLRFTNRRNGEAAKRRMQRAVAEGLEGRMLLTAGAAVFDAAVDCFTRSPTAMTLGDFNGDGQVDMAVATPPKPEAWPEPFDRVSVLLNRGGQLHATGYDMMVWEAYATKSLAAGDFNGDGKVDLAAGVSRSSGYMLDVWLNKGDGTFDNMSEYDAAGALVTSGELNGDGKADLVVVSSESNKVSVLLSTGNGVFDSGVEYSTGVDPRAINVADFNGDGTADLAVSNNGSNTVSVLLNQGDGTFGAGVEYGTGVHPQSITSGDINGDGRTDLAVTNTGAQSVSVLLNQGGGTFAGKVDYGINGTLSALTARDFDGDGKADLAVGSYRYGALSAGCWVSVLRKWGNGTFADRVDYGTSGAAGRLVSADFNGDGKADLAGNIGLLFNEGDGRFAARTVYETGKQPRGVTSADFNGDGRADLAVIGDSGVSVLLNSNNRAFAPYVEYADVRSLGSMTSADFNGDGKVDLAVTNLGDWTDVYYRNGSVGVMLNKGDGTFSARVEYLTGNYTRCVASADFNGDGKADLAAVNEYSKTVSVLLNKGDGTFSPVVNYNTVGSPTSVSAADFDGDGKADLAVSTSYDNRVRVFLNQGNGVFAATADYATGSSPQWTLSADLDADGDVDLVTANSGGQSVSVLLNKGNGTFAAKVDYHVGDGASRVTSADFNGDGTVDLAVTHDGSQEDPNPLSVLLNQGNGTFVGGGSYEMGYRPWSLTAADFNGDGKADLAVCIGDSNRVSVLQSVTPTPLVINSGGSTYIKVAEGQIGVWNNADGSGAPALTKPLALTSVVSVEGADGEGSITLDLSWGVSAPWERLAVEIIGGKQVLNVIGSGMFGLSVSGGGVVGLGAIGGNTLVLSKLSIEEGATLDLGRPGVVVRWVGGNFQGYDAVRGWIRSARDGGAWDKSGITSSSAREDHRGFAGVGVKLIPAGWDVIIRHTWNGDANLDGIINADDYFLVDSGYVSQVGGWGNGDFNYDGIVNADDYFMMDSAYVGQAGILGVQELQSSRVQGFESSRDEVVGVVEGLFGEEPIY